MYRSRFLPSVVRKITIFNPFDRMSGIRSASASRPTCMFRCPPLQIAYLNLLQMYLMCDDILEPLAMGLFPKWQTRLHFKEILCMQLKANTVLSFLTSLYRYYTNYWYSGYFTLYLCNSTIIKIVYKYVLYILRTNQCYWRHSTGSAQCPNLVRHSNKLGQVRNF